MRAALAVVLCVTALAAATMAVAAPVPGSLGYRTTLAGGTEGGGNAAVNVLDAADPVALQVRVAFFGLSSGLTGASFHFTDTGSGADLPATLSLPGLPIGEVSGGYAENFYLNRPNGSLFSPQYVSRYGTGAAPFLGLLQSGGLSLVVATSAFPNGEIRGVLTAAPALAPIPLPPAIAPMLLTP